ncbi:tetratricopeptide repeat protein [Actibacterium sp. XHP0104]|uniref:tetratricopeptide repeat protein n=1 Tax=Actibacterium sp. XHP0104 TaxID=2984335 RepID=UPI0021E8F057|nr:tetratricopeptide repeat protein [Actibacterium sp. XHP0104]MCV2881842.1 tetratricopeptide repeat protein [Actibacterium sp. XHP0104]
MRFAKAGLAALLLSASLLTAGCEDSEERAERHYQTGIELLEKGDVSRALVEFRNVFKLNPQHKDARLTYARTIKGNGHIAEAFGQYLRVVEQYPDTFEARIELAEMAISMLNWEEAERHGRRALELEPENLRARIVVNALDYAKAQRDSNPVAASQQADLARALVAEKPDSTIPRRILIDYLFNIGDLQAALPVLEDGLKLEPDSYDLHEAKLRILLRQDNQPALGDALRDMVERFPEDEKVQGFMISWFLTQDDHAGAEAFLRELANRPDADIARKITVLQFVRATRGDDAAREELERLINESDDPTRFIVIRASMDFDAGDTDKAITSLQTLTSTAAPSEALRDAKVVLARMLTGTDNVVGARAEVEEVLRDDPSHVEALKMRAAWMIEDDRTGDAIVDLRTALAQAPRDPMIMTLMAQAHERSGDRELAGERYALAVEVSNKAPAESLRYALHLVAQDRTDAARAVLDDALLQAPDNVLLLRTLAGLHVATKNWNETQRIIWKLKAIDTPDALQSATAIETGMMLEQERVDDTIAYLEGLVKEDEANLSTIVPLLQSQLRAGRQEEAVKLIDERLAKDPANPDLRFLRAGLHVLNNETDQAEAIYRGLLDQFPGEDKVLRTLNAFLVAQGRTDEAAALVDEQIAKNPKALNARLLKAERLERMHDFEGSIAIYEELYAENSNNMVVANNLASLISTHRDDDASLERAFAIARRLRGLELPPLQDTYGWIEYRRGNYQEAVENLEPAAEGLPRDPLVQYHLGMAYLAVNRTDEAKAQLERALEIGGEIPLPQMDHAREVLKDLADQ